MFLYGDLLSSLIFSMFIGSWHLLVAHITFRLLLLSLTWLFINFTFMYSGDYVWTDAEDPTLSHGGSGQPLSRHWRRSTRTTAHPTCFWQCSPAQTIRRLVLNCNVVVDDSVFYCIIPCWRSIFIIESTSSANSTPAASVAILLSGTALNIPYNNNIAAVVQKVLTDEVKEALLRSSAQSSGKSRTPPA